MLPSTSDVHSCIQNSSSSLLSSPAVRTCDLHIHSTHIHNHGPGSFLLSAPAPPRLIRALHSY
uniref:Uncharacterized protein n=1 Tax=Anguilla anguilla TaxID=7936 RepID=A0A0E9SGT0_ANGAN